MHFKRYSIVNLFLCSEYVCLPLMNLKKRFFKPKSWKLLRTNFAGFLHFWKKMCIWRTSDAKSIVANICLFLPSILFCLIFRCTQMITNTPKPTENGNFENSLTLILFHFEYFTVKIDSLQNDDFTLNAFTEWLSFRLPVGKKKQLSIERNDFGNPVMKYKWWLLRWLFTRFFIILSSSFNLWIKQKPMIDLRKTNWCKILPGSVSRWKNCPHVRPTPTSVQWQLDGSYSVTFFLIQFSS